MDEKDFWVRLMTATGITALVFGIGLIFGLAYYILTR